MLLNSQINNVQLMRYSELTFVIKREDWTSLNSYTNYQWDSIPKIKPMSFHEFWIINFEFFDKMADKPFAGEHAKASVDFLKKLYGQNRR